MEQQFDFEVQVKLKRKNRRKTWQRILGAMMCVVVFCTTYMLILPAITKETEAFCGLEEHAHGEACYEKVLLCESHVHTQECYASHSELVCTEPTDDGHTHTEACQPVTESLLTCTLAETEGHIHTEACQPVTESLLTCALAETEGHAHTESCTVTETVLSCQLEESEAHTHGEACYTEITSVVCGLEEAPAHAHGDDCYTLTTIYGCGLEEAEAHTHADGCYTQVTHYGCGLEEAPPSHVHAEACFATAQQLICSLEAAPDHEHTDACYEERLICEVPVHTHTLACFADASADLETAEQWEAMRPEATGDYIQAVLAVARGQVGYTESTRNYIVDENNNLKGYTRYGAWNGTPYGDWSAPFISFCLHYAGVKEIPPQADCSAWKSVLTDRNIYKAPADYVPKAGDIIFFDWEEDGNVDHMGLVENVVDTDVITIEGDSTDRVTQNKYSLFDSRIAGYGILSGLLVPPTEETPNTDSEPAPTIDLGNTDAWAVLVPTEEPTSSAYQVKPQSEVNKNTPVVNPSPAANTFGLGKLNNAARATELDLTPYINNVTMHDADGNPIPSGSVVSEGDLIEFKIDYTITGQQLGFMNGETVELVSNVLTYKIPEIFEMIQSNSGDIVNSAGMPVGTYIIDSETGTITLKFSESFVEQNAKGIQIHGNVSFFSTVVKITDSDSEDQKYHFTDGIVLGVIIEENNEAVGDLKIEKQKISVDGEDILYEIKVTSAEGTKGPVTVTDRMSAGLTFKEGISVRKGNGATVSSAVFDVAADKSSFTMTLPEMAPGESYTIRYRCTANVDLLGTDLTVRNTASVAGKDSQDNDLKDKVTVNHTFTLLKKTGVANDDGTITWTITVNQDKVDISGWTLQDIVITNTGETPYTGAVTIQNSAGNVVAANAYLPYTFPAGSKDTYTVTYTTSHDYADGSQIHNRAILKDDDTDVTVLTGVAIGEPLKKSGTAGEVVQIDGKYVLPITWTVTIDTSIGEIPAGQVLLDTMEDWNSNQMYMTYSQLMAAYENIKNALEAVGSSVSKFEAKEYRAGMGQVDGKYNYDALTGNVNGTHDKLYEYFEVTLGKAIPKGKLVTFTYETSGIFENNVLAGSAYTNQFSISDRYHVKSTVLYTAGSVKAKKMALLYYDPEVHGNSFWQWSLYHYNGTDGVTELEYEKLHEDYLAWVIELSVPLEYMGKGNIVLYEDLPEGVSVKGLTLPFNSDIPTKPLQLWDMEPGKTYEWTFDLYTAEQLLYWQHQNPQKTTITIYVTEDGDLEITIPGIIFETMAQYAVLYNKQANANLDEWYGYLHVYTQIDQDFEWTQTKGEDLVYVHEFENRFTLKNENGDVIDLGTQTQKITKNEKDGIIRKEATTDSNNIIHYSVVLNAYKKDLIENSGIIRIHDELTYKSTAAQPLRLRLVPGSVKLYEIRMYSDGSYDKLGEVTVNYDYGENNSEQGGITTWVHTIDMNVPDGKALLLEYAYKATGNKDVTHNVGNVCSISGVGEGSLDGDHKVEIQVKDATAQADTKGVMIYKVDAGSDGIFLEHARFNIYIWNEEQNDYIIVHHPENGNTDFTTDANGMIVLDSSTVDEEQFAYNTAYYIVEVESPNGYYLSPEPYYFYIANADKTRYPECMPKEGFNGHALTSGDIIYRQNVSDTTQIRVEKYWKSFGGADMTVTGAKVSSVTLELWQMLKGDPGSAKLYGTYTMTPDAKGNWSLTITDLPKATRNTDNTKGTDYLYFIKEVGVNGFGLESITNNDGINSGTIKLVNKEREGYLLPETGGTGTHLYTTAGLLLTLTGTASLLYMHKKRRREEQNTS